MDAQEPDSEPSHEMKVGSGVGEPHLAWPIGARIAHVDGGTGRDPARRKEEGRGLNSDGE